jgi:CBS domain-containing protein
MMAKDIMTKKVITIAPTASLKELARTLIKNRISGAPVADKSGKILGVVSEADLHRHGAFRAGIGASEIVRDESRERRPRLLPHVSQGRGGAGLGARRAVKPPVHRRRPPAA